MPEKPALPEKPARARKPKAKEEILEIIRPEVNFEKWAHIIFGASHSKSIRKQSREFRYTDSLPDGSSIDASITVHAYEGRLPSTKTRRVLLALIKLYEIRGLDERGILRYSLRELADILQLEWGSKTALALTRELFQLLAPITWRYAFVNAQGEKLSRLAGMHIIDEVDVVERRDRQGRECFERINTARFNPSIVENLKAGKTKPVNLAVTLELRSEIAQMLYAHLDIILSDKTRYERTTKNLFSDLFLESDEEYRYPSGRKRKVQKAIRELNGKPLATGILNLFLEHTKDGTDYKLVANKIAVIASPPPMAKKTKARAFFIPANPPAVVQLLTQEMSESIRGHQSEDMSLFETLAKTYKAELIERALAELRADGQAAHKPIAFFLAIIHRLAHQAGLRWIADCEEPCRFRTEH